MEKQGIHRVTVDDGVELAGHIYGHGPAVVFVHGALEDGEKFWSGMMPHLSDRFRCILLDMRGRGRSDAHPNVSPERQVRDVVTFVESIGEPVRIIGESGGGMWTLGAAARSAAISAVALYEPVVFEVMSPQQAQGFDDQVAQMRTLADDDQLVEAAKLFLRGAYSDDEWEMVSQDYLEASGKYVHKQLQEFEAITESDYSPTAPEVLRRIHAPLLLIHGGYGELADWVETGVRHIANNVDDARIRQLQDLSHAAPLLQPEIIAAELRQFFDATLSRGEAARPSM